MLYKKQSIYHLQTSEETLVMSSSQQMSYYVSIMSGRQTRRCCVHPFHSSPRRRLTLRGVKCSISGESRISAFQQRVIFFLFHWRDSLKRHWEQELSDVMFTLRDTERLLCTCVRYYMNIWPRLYFWLHVVTFKIWRQILYTWWHKNQSLPCFYKSVTNLLESQSYCQT